MSDLILAVDDNADALFALEQVLLKHGFRVVTAENGEEALEKARTERPAVILLDVMMPRVDGYQVTARLKADPELRFIPIILLTAKDSLEDIIKGLDRGADGYINKPFRPEELVARLRAALRLRNIYEELRRTESRNTQLLEQISSPFNFSNIIGRSPAMKQVISLLEKVVDVDSPVLITGPSGTGKELVARAIHFNSKRKVGPFIPVNCAAISEGLLESELFGHVKGSFTGAVKDKIGLFQAADHGTLFLDEVGEMLPALQAKLLRVLQEGTFLPVGATSERQADVRILAATNRDLSEMVEKGTFREDLYYRLNVINISLPPLKERREDIMPIVDNLLRKLADQRNTRAKSVTPAAANMLVEYKWRGNVRELENEIERMTILGADEEALGPELLSTRIRESVEKRPEDGSTTFSTAGKTLKQAIEEVERKMIQEALGRLGGNKSSAAKELGISRSSLIAKVQEYGLEPKERSN
ncbi:MAG: sigma-54 dependent transcriptional regulator [Bdellovibrionota bacterium]